MLTAHDSEDLKSVVIGAGADDCVRKPLSIERLRQRVERMPASLERAAARG
jgi:DNA-binding response OmpR family regulator